MSTQKSKFRITQTLLGAWLYSYKTDGGYDSFLKTLRREKVPPTKAMLDGVRFENCINAVLNGAEIDVSHEWYKPVTEISAELTGAQKQVVLFKNMSVDGVPFLLHGVLDFLLAGRIIDTKYSKSYRVGKYLDSPQHPMYFALVPEAYEFQYTICDGSYVYRETYRPEDCTPIETTIRQFMRFLDDQNLVDLYAQKWRV